MVVLKIIYLWKLFLYGIILKINLHLKRKCVKIVYFYFDEWKRPIDFSVGLVTTKTN